MTKPGIRKQMKNQTRLFHQKNGNSTLEYTNLGRKAYNQRVKLYIRYFYKGISMMSLPVLPDLTFKQMAYDTIKEHLEKGKNIKEIIDVVTKNLERKASQLRMLEVFAKSGCHITIEEYVGVEGKIFLIDWNNCIEILTKLKALKSDDKNGRLEYYSTKKIEERQHKNSFSG